MAADPTLVNAYKQYFDSQAQLDTANMMNDPFYIASQVATMAANEWTHEKKLDNEKARKKGEAISANMNEMFITAADGYNDQGKELMHGVISNFDEQMNIAVMNKDKKKISSLQMDSRTVATEFKRGQAILKDHASALSNGEYSDGAGTATLNKLLSGGAEDYEIYMESDPEKPNYLKPFFKVKDNDGGVQLLSFDDLDKGNVRRADDFGNGYDKLIKTMVKTATQDGVYEFDEGQVERLLDKSLANTDVMYSSFHDNIFGEKQSIKEMWEADPDHKGSNSDWQNIWNDQLPTSDEAVTGTIQNSGFNETQMREYTKTKMMEMAKNEYEMRLKAYQKKVSASSKKKGGNDSKFQIGDYQYAPKDVINNVAKNIKNKQTVVFEGSAFTPDGDGWMNDNGDSFTTQELIYTLDKDRGFIRNSSLFTNLLKPVL